MARNLTTFICQNCESKHTKWAGRCDTCGAWNSLLEDNVGDFAPKGLDLKKGRSVKFVGLDGLEAQPQRRVSKIVEFDRVTGGGLVPGSATLVGGDPGIGKSTLLMQVAAAMSRNFVCAYISGEEAIDQLRLRAFRLGLTNSPVKLATSTSVRDINSTLDKKDAPKIVIIDSIQSQIPIPHRAECPVPVRPVQFKLKLPC